MDPKQLSQLDPKLKEAYDRVMNTSAGTSQTAQATMPTAPMDRPMSTIPPQPQTAPPIPQPTPTEPHIISSTAVATAPVHDTRVSQGFIAENQKKSGGSSSILYIILGLLFFIAYGLFWVKFFKLPLPFLP